MCPTLWTLVRAKVVAMLRRGVFLFFFFKF